MKAKTKKIVFCLTASLLCMPTIYSATTADQTSGINFFINALYWQPREEGLDYMIKNSNGATFINAGSVERAEYDWHGGFRVGLGYSFADCCPIDFELSYTRFTSDGCNQLATTFPTVLFPVWSNPSTNIVYEQNARARVCLELDMVDAQVNSFFSPNDCVTVMPLLGLRFARIKQRFTINANGGQSQGPVAFVLDDAVAMNNDFKGVGPKVGIQSAWGSWCGLSLIGAFDVALLYGKFDLKQKETVAFSDDVPATTFLDITCNNFHITRPHMSMLLGLQWETQCGCYDIVASAGWEHNYFFGQNQLLRFSDDINPGVNTAVQGDLTMQGLTLNLGVSF